MNRVLIVHIGDSIEEVIGKGLGEKYEMIRLVDGDIKPENMNPDSKDTYVVNFENEDACIDLLLSLMPLDDIIISSHLDIKVGDDTAYRINELLGKVFLAIKYLYSPMMRKRRGKVWLIEPQVLWQGEDAIFIEPLIAALRGGVKALTKVAALELAKKKININYIGGNKQENYLKIEKIIHWSSKRSHIYLTAQDLNL